MTRELSYISLKLVRRSTNQGKMLKDRAIEQRLMQRSNSFVIPAYLLIANYIVLFFSPTKYMCKRDLIHIVFCLVVFSCCFEEWKKSVHCYISIVSWTFEIELLALRLTQRYDLSIRETFTRNVEYGNRRMLALLYTVDQCGFSTKRTKYRR